MMARNRYGWQKRAKELARKQKNDDKMKRRQGKITTLPEEDLPGPSGEEMDSLAETESAGEGLPASVSLPD
jgi:hypothetical protein